MIGPHGGVPLIPLRSPAEPARLLSLPKLAAEERSVAELERKIGQLTLENDFLKKALQHFREYHPPAVVSGATACAARSGKPVKAVRK